jgi:hypothetical protein
MGACQEGNVYIIGASNTLQDLSDHFSSAEEMAAYGERNQIEHLDWLGIWDNEVTEKYAAAFCPNRK